MRVRILASILGIAGLACAGGATPVTSDEPTPIEQAVRSAMAEIFQTGPAEADWNSSGSDIDSIITARPGGPSANYLFATDKDGERSITVYSPASVAKLIPKSWTILAQIGEPDSGAAMGPVVFEHMDRGFALVVRGTEQRNGGAFCTDKFVGAQLYATDQAEESEIPPDVAKMIFMASIEAVRDKQVCTRFSQNGGSFTVRYFMADGRTLTHMNDYREVIEIVPAAPIDGLLGSQ